MKKEEVEFLKGPPSQEQGAINVASSESNHFFSYV